MAASTPLVAAPPNGAGIRPLRNPAATALPNTGRNSNARVSGSGSSPHRGGELPQLALSEAPGGNLELFLFRGKKKRHGHRRGPLCQRFGGSASITRELAPVQTSAPRSGDGDRTAGVAQDEPCHGAGM